jgi:hypothetical protein
MGTGSEVSSQRYALDTFPTYVRELASNASKKGCGVTAAGLAAQPPPASSVTPPQDCNTAFLYAWANRCPPIVII